jgi:hypothetical protein
MSSPVLLLSHPNRVYLCLTSGLSVEPRKKRTPADESLKGFSLPMNCSFTLRLSSPRAPLSVSYSGNQPYTNVGKEAGEREWLGKIDGRRPARH